MGRAQLNLLGGFECCNAAGTPQAFPTRKIRALIAYLAMTAGQVHRREKLAGLLWGDRAEVQARADLRKSLSRLRASLPEEAKACLATDQGQVAFRPEILEVDARSFVRCAVDGTPETLEHAAALYRGPFLDGVDLSGEEAFELWLVAERRRLEETLRNVLQRLLDHYTMIGAVDRAIQMALRLLTLDPLQEAVHRTLIRLYLYQDRVGSALDQYRRCRDLLAAELGVKPTAETEQLRAQLLHLVPASGQGPLAPERDEPPERPAVFRAAAADRTRRRLALRGRPSIVVLSFAGKATELAHRDLGDALADDVATELGRFRELDVIAPTSALAFRDADVAPERVGGELGTAYVLEGRLRAVDSGLHITVRLIETATARQLWAERYDGGRADAWDVRDEVVRCIVRTLVGHVEDARFRAMARRRPDDLTAYDLWLRGWRVLQRPDLTAIGEARRWFQQAVVADPHFARAYVGLAMTHLNEWACFTWNHWVFPKEEVLALARRAVELDDHDQRAHCILGMTELYARDYEAARPRLLKALELNPNDADVLAHVAVGMALLGEQNLAVEIGRHALRLAPHGPEWHAAFAGEAFFAARLHEEAIATMAPAPEALCNTPAFLAASHAHLGQMELCAGHRETVARHHQRQLARGLFPRGMGCIDWLVAMDPFRREADADHYVQGLRKAGFE